MTEIDRLKKFRLMILDYEIRSTWWSGLLPFFLNGIQSRYFAWKVNRKFNRFLHSKNVQHRLKSKHARKHSSNTSKVQ